MIDKQKAELLIKDWLKKNEIKRNQGTWLHIAGFWIHLLGKITAFWPQPKIKHKLQPVKIDIALFNQISEKYDFYKKQSTDRGHIDSAGFIESSYCDSTLFTGLLSFCRLYKVDLIAAKGADGFWHRRDALKPCYPDHSKSSFSRDMMIGVLWWILATKNKKQAEDLYKHLKEHSFVMGLGDPSRLLLMPSLEATLAELIKTLGGKNHFMARKMIQLWPRNLKGYQIHLSICHGLLRGIMLGGITDSMLKSFKHYAEANKHNPLYQLAYALFTDGDCNNAARLLLDSRIWPSNRLPREIDRKSSWVTQRDYGPNWLPAPTEVSTVEHSGGDFLHVAGIIIQLYR